VVVGRGENYEPARVTYRNVLIIYHQPPDTISNSVGGGGGGGRPLTHQLSARFHDSIRRYTVYCIYSPRSNDVPVGGVVLLACVSRAVGCRTLSVDLEDYLLPPIVLPYVLTCLWWRSWEVLSRLSPSRKQCHKTDGQTRQTSIRDCLAFLSFPLLSIPFRYLNT
jgi:hypothetical protein